MCLAVQQIRFTGKTGRFFRIAFNFQEIIQVREGRSATGFSDSKSDNLCLPMFYVFLCVKKNTYHIGRHRT